MTVTTGVDVRRVSGALGAEVRGVALGGLDDAGFDGLRSLLLEHHVLFFPDQHLTHDEHRSLAAMFGPLEIHPFIPKVDGYPEIVVLRGEEGFIADVWHTDVTFEQSPPVCSVLQTVTCPRVGGDTMWSNQHLVFESLAPPVQELLHGLTAVNTAAVFGQPDRRAVHPVVRRHPDTGRPSLFVNRQFTQRIVEVSRPESDALLAMLFGFSEQPQFTCRYAWPGAGTVAIWDNRCTQHYVVNDFTGQRVVQRVTVLGDHPEPHGDTGRWRPHEARNVSAASVGLDRP